MSVPIVNSLSDIYPSDAVDEQTSRWRHLLQTFEKTYGHEAAFVARSPGRVNILGEHIDYSLYSVLPMAIAADCLIAVRPVATPADAKTFRIEIANVLPQFAAHSFDIPLDAVDIDASVHEWTNYFKSGLRGALELLRTLQGGKDGSVRPTGMQVLLDGTVPVGGGLSSSAAFTSTSALSVLFANGVNKVDKTQLTELAIVSERSVGVNSGGMDQAASVFAERGAALFVSFYPSLKAEPVHLPVTNPEISFLIAQSFVAADKFVTGPIHYNLRVVECTLAAAYLNALLNPSGTVLPADNGPLGTSLRGFHTTYFAAQKAAGKTDLPTTLPEQLDVLVKLADATLTKTEGYTREEIATVLGTTVDDLHARYMTRFPVRAERFKLRQRAGHVFREAGRVLAFLRLLQNPPKTPDAAYNEQLGALLNETQDSCRDVYENSCPEIDEMCAIARRAGSYGSRVTGAGWGGCSVHLAPSDKVEAIKAAWEKEYYAKRDLTAEQRAAAIVSSRPGSGSAVWKVASL